jgi:hypothetical protein
MAIKREKPATSAKAIAASRLLMVDGRMAGVSLACSAGFIRTPSFEAGKNLDAFRTATYDRQTLQPF